MLEKYFNLRIGFNNCNLASIILFTYSNKQRIEIKYSFKIDDFGNIIIDSMVNA